MPDDPIDRARLPIADPGFTGVADRTLEGSRPDWGLIDIKPYLRADDDQALHESAHHGHVAHGISG
jgi:hypothetical protein